MKRVGIYVRVSTLDQSTELQKKELAQFVQSRGWHCVQIYEDKASGTTAARPQLQAMLSDARSRKLDLVLCWKMDRLFRSLKHLITTIAELNELGVEFVSLKDNIDLSTSSGRLMTHMLAAFAEFEADIIRERVMAGLRNAKAKGKVLGRPKRINPSMVASLREKGLSLSEIGRQLGISKSAVSKTLTALGCKIPLKISNNTQE